MKLSLYFLMITLMFSSCCFNSEHNTTPFGNSYKYVKGKVIIRAESKYPIGMIKIADIFEDDEYMESPSRAILYKYKEDSRPESDLYDIVYFKIAEKDGVQYAVNLRTNEGLEDTMSKSELYPLLEKFSINLHNSDPHREGPQHKRKHVRPRPNRTSIAPNVYVYELRKPDDPITGPFQKYMIYTTNTFLANTDYYLYFDSKAIANGIGPSLTNSLDLDDPDNVYTLSRTHDHIH